MTARRSAEAGIRKPMDKISVLIDNFNYGAYVAGAVRSVLSQDYPDFELIVVDDGSTDDSLETLSIFSDDRLTVIAKPNGGQLSAFNAGFAAATGTIICFLDADDLYLPGYLAAVAENFSAHPECGCLLADVEYFGRRSGRGRSYPDGALGCDPFSVATRHLWRGVPTSAIALRREVASAILPCTDNEDFWRTRADDLLVWGAELAGAVKHCFSTPPVRYRIHDGNLFFGNRASGGELRRRREAADRFCAWVMKRNDLTLSQLLEIEELKGDTAFSGRLRGWLRAGWTGLAAWGEWLKCGSRLWRGVFVGRGRRK